MNGTRSLLQWFPNSTHLSSTLGSWMIFVDFLVVHYVRLQFFVTEVMKAPVNNKKYFSLLLFTISVFFIGFSYYTYRSQENFLFFFPLIYELTRRDRFFYSCKMSNTIVAWILYVQHVDVFLFLVTVSRRGRTCLFSMLYVDRHRIRI